MPDSIRPADRTYGTVVADPPWPIRDFPAKLHGDGTALRTKRQTIQPDGRDVACPYPTMTLDAIRDLPVRDLAAPDAHLYLWTINQYLEQAYEVCRSWGFKPGQVLVWCKAPKGRGFGNSFANATEYVIFARRGRPTPVGRVGSNWWEWPRSAHSAKPEAFLDIVEQVSPGPYLELFARRNRLGWDTWGNESFEHVELAA
jgi:N6-adenosine-specific RNA methylase IME4